MLQLTLSQYTSFTKTEMCCVTGDSFIFSAQDEKNYSILSFERYVLLLVLNALAKKTNTVVL